MMKKTILLSVTIGIILSACQESRENKFERLAKEYTAKCPQEVGEGVRIDSMKYNKKSNTNSYYYTLSGTIDSADSIAKKRGTMESAMIEAVRGSVELKEYKDFKTTIDYVYFSDKTKKELLHISVNAKLY